MSRNLLGGEKLTQGKIKLVFPVPAVSCNIQVSILSSLILFALGGLLEYLLYYENSGLDSK